MTTQDAHQHVGLVLQGREKAAVRLRRGGDLVGEAVGADRLGFVAAAAGHAEAARQHGVAGALDHEVGLAGEQRLVELEVARPHDAAVDHDLVARLRPDDVADDELAGSTSRSRPSRSTTACGLVRMAMRSRVRLARTSW